MKLFIVPVPILNREMKVVAYLFRHQIADKLLLSNQATNPFDSSIESPVLEILDTVGLDAFTNGKPIYIPITNVALLTDLDNQCKEAPENIFFVLNRRTSVDEVILTRINYFKEKGYRFALSDLNNQNIGTFGELLPLMDSLLLESQNTDLKILTLLKNKFPKLTLVACNVDSTKAFQDLKPSLYDFFEGLFYRLPVTKGLHTVSPLKVNSLQLLNLVRDENFELADLVDTVHKDTALSVSLLKIVNSAHIGMLQKIKSLNQAAAILGQTELRKWVTTAVAKSLGEDRPNELTKLSLTRAKFAENLAPLFKLERHSDSLFLMGLFSILDAILQVSMEQAFNIINISDEIRDALVNQQGMYYPVYEFMLQYEMADWQGVSRALILNDFDASSCFKSYLSSITWYSGLIADM